MSDLVCGIVFHLGKRQEKKKNESHTTNLDKVRQDRFLVPEDQRCRATQMNMVTQFREGAKAQHVASVEGEREGSTTPFDFPGMDDPGAKCSQLLKCVDSM